MAVLHKIDWAFLKSFEKDYLINKWTLKLAQNALVQNDLFAATVKRTNHYLFNNEFSHLVSDDLPKVTDQKMSGRCWLFALTNMVKHHFVQKHKVENFEFSNAYLAFYHKLEKANVFLNFLLTNHTELEDSYFRYLFFNYLGHSEDGGFFQAAQQLVLKYGLIPRFLMDDSAVAKNTQLLNQLLAIKFHQAYQALLKNPPTTTAAKTAFKATYLQTVYQILVSCYGQPPEQFDVQLKTTDKKKKWLVWKKLTPQTFLQKIGFDLANYQTVMYSPLAHIKKFQNYQLAHTTYLQEHGDMTFYSVDHNTFKMVALIMLASKTPTYFAADVSWFLDTKTGVWDQFNYGWENLLALFWEKEPEFLTKTFETSVNHAMVLYGYDLNEPAFQQHKKAFLKKHSKQKPTITDLTTYFGNIPIHKWSAENSWGEKEGNKGMFTISNAFFTDYVYEIAVHLPTIANFFQKPTFLTQKQLHSTVLPKTKNKEKVVKKSVALYQACFANGLTTKPETIPINSPSFAFLKR